MMKRKLNINMKRFTFSQPFPRLYMARHNILFAIPRIFLYYPSLLSQLMLYLTESVHFSRGWCDFLSFRRNQKYKTKPNIIPTYVIFCEVCPFLCFPTKVEGSVFRFIISRWTVNTHNSILVLRMDTTIDKFKEMYPKFTCSRRVNWNTCHWK